MVEVRARTEHRRHTMSNQTTSFIGTQSADPSRENYEPARWTVAYRNPRANRFLRVNGWAGTWNEARLMGQRFGTEYPDLQVWLTTTKDAEASGYCVPEDVGNVMVESGKRVRVLDVEFRNSL